MSPAGAGRPGGLPRAKIALLLGAPLVVALAVAVGGLPGLGPAPDREQVEERLALEFQRILRAASALTERALAGEPVAIPERFGRTSIEQRLEGVGFIGAGVGFESWIGVPAGAGDHFTVPDAPRWSVRREGIRTRLIVRAGPDADGRWALGSFLLESAVDELRLEQLVPPTAVRGFDLDIEYAARGAPRPGESAFERLEGGDETILLTSPEGRLLARAGIAPLDLDRRASTLRRLGVGWALALFVLLLGTLWDWSRLSRSPRGWLAATAAIAGGRALLLVADAPALLLPRGVGTASLFGSTRWGGLLGSPGDLALTGLALFLFAAVTRILCGSLRGARPFVGSALAAVGAAASLVAAGAMTISLARDSRIDVLYAAGGGVHAPVRWLLILGWALALLGAAELLATLPARLQRRPGAPRPARVAVGGAFVLLAALGCGYLHEIHGDALRERLRSEFAPQVFEQSARRRLALTESVRSARAALERAGGPEAFEGDRAKFLAYHFWVQSELFHSGFQSSLDLYDADGDGLSHFGFDLPPVDDPGGVPQIPPELELRVEEFYPSAARLPQRLLVAEAPVVVDGEIAGHVVGRVVDEPSNLPFMPGNLIYLAALGAGAPLPLDGELESGLHYVLYDADGAVRVGTLGQPPPLDRALERAADLGGRVEVVSGGETFAGIALRHDSRVHLLLVPDAGPLARAAAVVRVVLAGLTWMLLVGAVRFAVRGAGPAALLDSVRGSFYRKLLAALLVASAVPLIGLSLLLGEFIERAANTALIENAADEARRAQLWVEDYLSAEQETDVGVADALTDNILFWLHRIVGQEMHVYVDGRLHASSKRELFSSGLLEKRLHGSAQRALFDQRLPSYVRTSLLGPNPIPVAFARVRPPLDEAGRQVVVAVPLLQSPTELRKAVQRLRDMILLATVALVGLLAAAAALLARTVARPVRELVGATGRIAEGDYEARLQTRTRDELAELVGGFNRMAGALADQRADLERRREYTERLVSHATTGVVSTDAAGRLVKLNPAAEALLHPAAPLTPGDVLLERLAAEESLRPLARALIPGPADRPAAGADRPEPREVDLEIDGAPHRYRFVRIELAIPGTEDKGSLILIDDVTDLMRSNQLEAWAEMARAIAHEIKNPLTPIQLSTEHARRILRDRGVLPDDALDACLDTVIKQVRALHQIAGEFSMYSKLPSLALEPTDPVALLRATIGPYRAAHPPGVEVREEYAASPTIQADGRVLERALVNLVENALHAMPDGGVLTASVAAVDDGRAVELAVADTGSGLEPEVRRRLFEPYFSTKSSGTGLGLAIVKRAVEAHQGTIEVDSTPGAGTAFRIRIPAAAGS